MMFKYYCFILILISMELIECSDNSQMQNRTVFDPTAKRFDRILRRKKRFLLFPPGSAIVTTLSFTKTLVPRSPSGINMIGECDIFYPLQTQISDWYPTTTTRKPPPDAEYDDEDANVAPMNTVNTTGGTGSNVNNFPLSNGNGGGSDTDDGNNALTGEQLGIPMDQLISDPNYNVGKHPGEVYVNNAKSKTPPRRYDKLGYSYKTSPWDNYLQTNGVYHTNAQKYSSSPKYVSNAADKYHGSEINENDLWRNIPPRPPSKIYYPKIQSQEQQLKSRQSQHYSSDRSRYGRDTRKRKRMNVDEAAKSKTNEKLPHRGSRERRDFYGQLESLITFNGFDTKACILRMICEANHYLLPQGKSLFQDIFRVLFTLPLEKNLSDEYSHAMHSTEEDCRLEYSKSCQYSVLGYLMSSERPIL